MIFPFLKKGLGNKKPTSLNAKSVEKIFMERRVAAKNAQICHLRLFPKRALMRDAFVRNWGISEAYRVFLEYLGDVVNSFLLFCIHDFCINLSRFQFPMTKKFAHCIDVSAECQHQHGECVASDMERYVLVDSRPQCPYPQTFVCF